MIATELPPKKIEDSSVKPAKRHRKTCIPLKLGPTTEQSRRKAAAILEVLAGARTPTDAATALNVSLVAYYKIEARALQGLIDGCQPPVLGRQPSPDLELSRLRKQCSSLQQELHRYQALARTAQKAAGLPPPAPRKTDVKGRRKRKPSVRALRALESIKRHPPDAASPAAGDPPSAEVVKETVA